MYWMYAHVNLCTVEQMYVVLSKLSQQDEAYVR